MRILYVGSSDFGEKCLEYLKREEEVIGIITNPDKPAGRGRQSSITAIKAAGLKYGLPILQTGNINLAENIEQIRSLNPDLIITIAFGQIISKTLLDQFPGRWLNVHGSLLPAYRGAAPINYALFNDDRETGVTVIIMNERLDAGAMISKSKIAISDDDNFGTLYAKLQTLAVEALREAVTQYKTQCKVVGEPQDEKSATYTAKITKNDCRVDTGISASGLINRIRGLSPSPCCRLDTEYGSLKIYAAHLTGNSAAVMTAAAELAVGALFTLTGKIYYKCIDGIIEITELQREGKSRLDSASFINGLRIKSDSLKILR